MVEYTQEQLDALIAEKVSEARKGLFTEEELQKRITAEADRRVETGIQKGLETYKSKWQAEFEEKSKLTAEQLAQKQLGEKMRELEQRERDLARNSNKLTAKTEFTQASIPVDKYEKFLDKLVADDVEVTKSNVREFIDMFESTKLELETKIKSELANVKAPKQGEKDVVTKEKFATMSYGERLALKQNQPDLYNSFIKS